MEPTTTRPRWGTKRNYQHLARVALALSLVLAGFATWSIWMYTTRGERTLLEANQNLLQVGEYYDQNRNTHPITSLNYVDNNQNCPTGMTPVPSLYRWPGNAVGCKDSLNVIHARACHANSGTVVPANGPVDLSSWKGGHFCVKRNTADVTARKAGAACAAGTVACSACECRKGANAANVCPVTQLTLGAAKAGQSNCGAAKRASGGVVAHCAWEANQHDLVNVEVSMYGMPCKSAKRSPKGPSTLFKLLLNQGEGCGEFEADGDSVQADTAKENSFYASQGGNAAFKKVRDALGADYVLSVKRADGDAHLVGRYRVQTSCSAACQGFRMNAHRLLTWVNKVWGRVRTLSWVAGCGSMISLVLLLWVVLVQRRSASQTSYVCLYVVTLVLMLVLFVMTWVTIADMRHLNHHRRHAVAAVHNKCVVDKNWHSVVERVVEHTDFHSLHRWLLTFVVGLALCWVLGVWTVVRTSQRLSELDQQNEHFM